jgi:nucleoside-diphosphate-sugar epimerase
VPLLVGAGHEVAGMTRSPDKVAMLESLGAQPVVCDVYDSERLRHVVAAFGPHAVLSELTDLPDDGGRISEFAAANARIRREGTRNLINAASAAGVTRFVAQSVAWQIPGDGGTAVADLERMVLDIDGVVVRYGQFYGPGTFHEHELPDAPRIHIDAAARLTLPALELSGTILTIAEE